MGRDKCDHAKSEIVATYKLTEVNINGNTQQVVRRRRCCKACGGRWNTYEIPDNEYKTLVRVKEMIKDGRDEWGRRK